MFRSLLADLPLAPLAIIFGLCWGSFLNVVAYRLLCGTSPLRGRSCCPTCGKTIAWYDLLPVLSWLLLRARCRRCHTPISWLYPFIELLTAGALLGIVLFAPMHYWPWLFIYVSALIVTIRTDISDLTIMRHTTIGLLPLALLGAHTGFLPLSLSESCLGMLVGGGFMALVSTIFWLLTRKIGLGQGEVGKQGIKDRMAIGRIEEDVTEPTI
ncbi:MAG: prepilin peptidase, partial [Candidatus Dependentiae bacterium]|nr:prepilin peptidase [Candidatus Dependentiae bacterium]